MKLVKTVRSLKETLGNYANSDIGFVPTMGALHDGHLSLVRRSCSENAISVISIFVNPTQFNDPEDLKKYPRDIESDLDMLKGLLSPDDIVFSPDYKDLYILETEFSLDLNGLDTVMEGQHRPGHFKGVVRVVKLLFEAVMPGRAYFGQKDFQQLSIITEMVAQLNMDVDIIACPILREKNGLAMSSRNNRLSPKIRENAGIIHSTLNKYNIISSPSEIAKVEEKVINTINSLEGFEVEYFEIVDSVSLTKVTSASDLSPDRKYFACIALFAEEIRLIDNIEISFQFLKG